MATTRTLRPVAACAFCAGPMPPPAGTGRPAVFCSGGCRKAAHEARRTAQPGAFTVKVVDRVVVENHDLPGCVEAVIASPAACRRVLAALAQLPAGTLEHDPKWRPTHTAALAQLPAGTLEHDPKWRPTHTAALALVDALTAPAGPCPTTPRDGAAAMIEPMTTATRTAWRPRWVIAFLAAVLAVAVGLFGAGPASAATTSTAQNAVGASTSAAQVAVGSSAGITAGQQLGNSPPQPQIVAATGVAAEGVVTASRIGTGATSSGSRITLDAARAAAERNGIGTRLMDLGYEAGAPGQYGYTSFNGAGQLIRGSSGRFQTTLTDLGLRSEQDAVNTIAHELNHIRESLATGGFPAGEGPANLSGDLAELFFR